MIRRPLSLLTIFLKNGTVRHFSVISTMIEDGFLKVIDKNCVLHAFNTDEVHSYKLTIDFTQTH